MASLTERSTSKAGDVFGIDEKQRSREFTLIVDAVTDDPIASAQSLMPINRAHPTDKSLRVSRYRVVSREAPLIWVVVIEYDAVPGYRIGKVGNWLITMQSGSATERMFQELADPDNPTADVQTVGPGKYKIWTDTGGTPPANLYKTRTQDGEKQLELLPGPNRPDGMDAVTADTTIELNALFTRMSAYTMRQAAEFKRSVNLNAWIDNQFPAATLLYLGANIRETIGVLSNSTSEQYLYDVTLSFSFNPEGHTPLWRTDTFVDDDGYESIVKTQDDLDVRRPFRRYLAKDFNNLTGLFTV